MSWQSDDGLHEGYAAHIAIDGREALATCADGMLVPFGSGTIRDEVVPWSDLLGWEARCTCGWVGPMWRRRGRDLQDADEAPAERLGPDAGRTWTPCVEDAVQDVWLLHLAAIGAA